jgi:hypothetical protein
MHAADGLSVVPMALSEEHLAWAVAKGNDVLLRKANNYLLDASPGEEPSKGASTLDGREPLSRI